MILEVAEIDINSSDRAGFEAVMDEALDMLREAKGFRGARLYKSREVERRYRLLVTWDKIENHVVDWQRSDAFSTWRSMLQPYFVSLPSVEHMELVLDRTEVAAAK